MSEDTVEIMEGDIVKIDMGVHVDGYIAVVAHTPGPPRLEQTRPPLTGARPPLSEAQARPSGQRPSTALCAWLIVRLGHRGHGTLLGRGGVCLSSLPS